ncbi:MAG: hypothetical protein ACJAUY_000967 [Cognaticolwellia sp.]|jgi:hypothetical protein|tara:strand:- start:4109 stop:4681 length:573 start_codon:yes stop_codon:yes gene_type:complete
MFQMKKLIVLLTISTLSTSAIAEETSWFDSLKSLVGLGETTEQTVDAPAPTQQNTAGLVDMLTSSLDVNADQAAGGMGSIFNYVKENVSAEQFSTLAKSIPGVEGLVGQMPDISQLNSGSSEGFGGLLDKASQYSDSLKSVNDIKKQFEALGLKPEMITSFISTAQSYLDTEQGQQAKQILTDGLSKFIG